MISCTVILPLTKWVFYEQQLTTCTNTSLHLLLLKSFKISVAWLYYLGTWWKCYCCWRSLCCWNICYCCCDTWWCCGTFCFWNICYWGCITCSRQGKFWCFSPCNFCLFLLCHMLQLWHILLLLLLLWGYVLLFLLRRRSSMGNKQPRRSPKQKNCIHSKKCLQDQMWPTYARAKSNSWIGKLWLWLKMDKFGCLNTVYLLLQKHQRSNIFLLHRHQGWKANIK